MKYRMMQLLMLSIIWFVASNVNQISAAEYIIDQSIPLDNGIVLHIAITDPKGGILKAIDIEKSAIKYELEVNVTFENTGAEPIRNRLIASEKPAESSVTLIVADVEIAPIAMKYKALGNFYRTTRTPGGAAQPDSCQDFNAVGLMDENGEHRGIISYFCTLPGEQDTVQFMFPRLDDFIQAVIKIKHSAEEEILIQAYLPNERTLNLVSDQELLSDIALHANNSWMQQYVIHRIEDQSVLETIATDDRKSAVRIAAIARIENSRLLKQLVKTDRDDNVRIAAVRTLSDQKFLQEVVRADSVWQVREAAATVITKQSLLAEIVKNDPHDVVRLAAINSLVRQKTPNQKLLRQIAQSAADVVVRQAAVWSLTDQKALADILKTEPAWDVRRAALKNVTEQQTFEYVAKNDTQWRVRNSAIKRLTNKTLLKEIARLDPETNVRDAAEKRLQQLE